MMRGCVGRGIRFIACGCLALCLASSLAFAAGERPEAAVTAIQTALDQADLAAFERRVDMDALIGEGCAVFMSKLSTAGATGDLPPVLALLASAAGTPQGAAAMRGLLAGETAAFVRDGVASGRFGGGKARSAERSRGLLAPLFAEASTGRKSLRAVGRAVPVTAAGDVVELPVAIRDAGNGREYRLRLRLEQALPEGSAGASAKAAGSAGSPFWKVTRIADLPAIADRLWDEAMPRGGSAAR